jgi:serine/threonine-protein kinase
MVPIKSQERIIGGRYKILDLAAHGGMADIFLAWDQTLERQVAIKILGNDYSYDESFKSRFIFEAKAAANLTHINIVTVHDFGFENGSPYLVMEYISGTDLKSIILDQHKLLVKDALPLILQACAGIGYAHRAGLVHCDVKPHNLIISRDRRLKVTDFGIARALSSINPYESSDVVWGSPLYFSPEQASGLAPSPASDVYSLGVVLYECLVGQPPFYSEDVSELSIMHRENPPLPPRYFDPNIPDSLQKIILRALSKEPASRYRNGDQMGRVLQSFCDQTKISTPFSLFTTDPNNTGWDESSSSGFDWSIVGLAFLTLFLVSGLVPFWFYIILRYGNIFN